MSDSGHHQHHTHGEPAVGAAFVVAVALNLTFALAEAVVAVLANSASLLADAGHNFGDVAGLLLAWGASYLAGIKSNETHSYGYRRSTILAAIVNALILVFTAALIGFEASHKFFNPREVAELPVILVAGLGILINGATARLFIRSSQSDLNARAAYLHLLSDAMVSIGVVVTGALIYWTGWQILDPLAGLAIAAVILAGAWSVLRDSVNLILDGVPSHLEAQEVKDWLRQLDGVLDVHDVHIWGMSTRETVMTAHLVMPANNLWESRNGFAEISEELKRRFRIHHVTLQVEKDQECRNECCCD